MSDGEGVTIFPEIHISFRRAGTGIPVLAAGKSTDCGPPEVTVPGKGEGGNEQEAVKAAHRNAKENGQSSCEGTCTGSTEASKISCNYFETKWELRSSAFDSSKNKWVAEGTSTGKCQCE